jgi:hypothetical protein
VDKPFLIACDNKHDAHNKELNVTAELAQAAEHNDHQLYVVSMILDARYNEQEIFHELLVAWRGFPVGEATC